MVHDVKAACGPPVIMTQPNRIGMPETKFMHSIQSVVTTSVVSYFSTENVAAQLSNKPSPRFSSNIWLT